MTQCLLEIKGQFDGKIHLYMTLSCYIFPMFCNVTNPTVTQPEAYLNTGKNQIFQGLVLGSLISSAYYTYDSNIINIGYYS